jgi:hypothetical protein
MKKIIISAIAFGLIFTSFALAKPGGGRSYSGGSKPASGSSYSSKPSGKSYSGSSSKPSSSSSGKTYSGSSSSSSTSTTAGKQPTKVTYDSSALKDHKTTESKTTYKATFQKGEGSKTEYKDNKGNSVKIDPKDKKIESLRTKLDHEKWTNRELRQNFYTSYYARPSIFPIGIHYSDPYNPWFFMWLMDRSIDDRARWMYNHRDSMDQTRYKELLVKDAALEAKIRKLEADKVAKDPTYAPSGMDSDLMYTDDYVDAVYNPHKMVDGDSGSSAVGIFLGIVFVIMVISGLVYLVFFHRF